VDYNHFKVENPAFEIEDRRSSVINFNATFQNIGLRVGLTRVI